MTGVISAGVFATVLGVSIKLASCLGGGNASETASWVQAVGAILAIVVGFAAILCQRAFEQADADAVRATNARAAHLVATHAMTTLGERLDAVLAPSTSKHPYRLRGERTAEMVASLREFDTSRIPHEMLEKFLQLRANLHAINERISDVYERERTSASGARSRVQRATDLKGAVTIWAESRTLLADIGTMLLQAGQTGLADTPATFAFETPRAPSRGSKGAKTA